MKHFTRTQDLTKEEYLELFRRAEIFETGLKEKRNFTNLCPGKVIATYFFQESTRTSASLQSAMIKLGGGWFGISGIKGTYLETGEEDIDDTLTSIAPLCDILAIRHKTFDLSAFAKKGYPIPLINAMCGDKEHAIGALFCVYTVMKHLEDLKGKKIGVYGMSKSSRPMKAVSNVLSHFDVSFIEDSIIPEMALPEKNQTLVQEHGSTYEQAKLDDMLDHVDFLFIVEGLPQSGEDESLVAEFNKNFVPFSNTQLEKMRENVPVCVFEPRATADSRLTALKETDDDPRMVVNEMLEAAIYTNMALVTYLLDIPVTDRI
ncbi:hypothetical protein KKH43_01270 [Patescibacteria group bacterium]|nr:hypothetical protein [Patescibacteria group bacterium]